MPLTVKTFTQLVSDQVAAMQGAVPNLQFPIGSINLALVESNAGVGLWLQGIMLQLVAITRASSSTGSDLDSWMADYGFYRNPAEPASGPVVFARATPTNQAVVPVGAIVQTQAGDIQFSVYSDPSNPNFNAGLNGYVLAPSITNISVPVIALVPGSAGNVNPDTIDQIASPISGVDTVNNTSAFTNGVDTESDASFRARFIVYINSLYAGTLLAYQNAITNGTPGLFYNIIENINFSDVAQLGFVTIIIDDGSGNPPTSLLDAITTKINNIRALAIQFGVYAVVVLTTPISMDVSIDPSYNSTTVIAQMTATIGGYIAELEIGQTLTYTKLFQIIYNSSPGILDITNLLINGSTTDLVASFKQRIFLGTLTITAV